MNNIHHLRPPILTGKMDSVVFDLEKKIDVHCNARNPGLSRLAGSSMGRSKIPLRGGHRPWALPESSLESGNGNLFKAISTTIGGGWSNI